VSAAPEQASPDAAAPLLEESIFGHLERVRWIGEQLERSDRVLEFGCGTGYFIVYPLLRWGYDVIGVDLDAQSISYGTKLLAQAGLDPQALSTANLRELGGSFDAVIASEVFEHLTDAELEDSLALIHSRLAPGGRLIVTVPNGYGWFELESLVWRALRAETLLNRAASSRLGRRLKRALPVRGDDPPAEPYPMTLAPSPHLQRFTWRSLVRTLEHAGFEIVQRRGAVLVCGAFSHLLLSRRRRIVDLNIRLGRRLRPVASDFYLVALRH